MVYGFWSPVSGLWFLVSGFWSLVSGLWFLSTRKLIRGTPASSLQKIPQIEAEIAQKGHFRMETNKKPLKPSLTRKSMNFIKTLVV